MKLVIFTHPAFIPSSSMPRFAGMLVSGMRVRGHEVEVLTPAAWFSKIAPNQFLRKWLGYFDQFLIFPIFAYFRILILGKSVLYIFADHALGLWVPLVRGRANIVHCHDFLAQRSALGEFCQNKTSVTGRIYQTLIRWGFKQSMAFISISSATQSDLHRMVGTLPAFSKVVLNPLNFDFRPISYVDAKMELGSKIQLSDERGFLIHVGGNQWYKNRVGVVQLYSAYCRKLTSVGERPIPLWLIGSRPNAGLLIELSSVPEGGEVRLLHGLSNEEVRAAYNLAQALIFPSLYEGFGWPLLEGLACGTPIFTTGQAPMNEICQEAAAYHERMPAADSIGWADQGADVLIRLLQESSDTKLSRRSLGIAQAKKFELNHALDAYEQFYLEVMKNWQSPSVYS